MGHAFALKHMISTEPDASCASAALHWTADSGTKVVIIPDKMAVLIQVCMGRPGQLTDALQCTLRVHSYSVFLFLQCLPQELKVIVGPLSGRWSAVKTSLLV